MDFKSNSSHALRAVLVVIPIRGFPQECRLECTAILCFLSLTMASIRLAMSRRLHFFKSESTRERATSCAAGGVVAARPGKPRNSRQASRRTAEPSWGPRRADVACWGGSRRTPREGRRPTRLVLIQLSKSDSSTLVKRAGHS